MRQYLLNRIPDDVLRECIIPYTYAPQSKELCEDIRNYFEVSNDLFDMYRKEYINGYENEDKDWLINDITRFMNQDQATMYGYIDYYIQFFRRMYRLQNADRDRIINFFKNSELYPFPRDINRNIALMTPVERKQMKNFIMRINNYS
jgi:hypothetical protein